MQEISITLFYSHQTKHFPSVLNSHEFVIVSFQSNKRWNTVAAAGVLLGLSWTLECLCGDSNGCRTQVERA